jgi:hypothetical protein
MISQDGDVAGDICWTAPERTSLAAPLQARFSSQIAIPHVEGARALLHRAIDSGELPADTAVDLLLDSLYGAIVTRMILSPPGERAQLAAEPRRYAVPIVDFVLSGLPAIAR